MRGQHEWGALLERGAALVYGRIDLVADASIPEDVVFVGFDEVPVGTECAVAKEPNTGFGVVSIIIV